MDEFMKDGEKLNLAASVIQRRWRDFMSRSNFMTDEAEGGGHDNGGSLFDKERTEEEIRESLLDQCRTLLADRESIRDANFSHQKTLCKHFSEKRGGAPLNQEQSLTADADAKYWDTVRRVRAERTDLEQMRESLDGAVDDIRARHDILVDEAASHEQSFRDYLQKKIDEACGVVLTSSAKKRRLPKGSWEEFNDQDETTHVELRDARVHYIRLRNKLKRQQKEMDGRERGRHTGGKDSGMHMIDYEQLKIENTNLNEKIEERNEELLKLRKKATTTIHILTHVKEKMEFIRNENVTLQRQVGTMEETLTSLRDKLNQSKRERDHFANENIHMREKMPMIGSEDLLLDYEIRKKEIEKCRINIVDLTNKHHQLVQWINAHQPLLDTMKSSV